MKTPSWEDALRELHIAVASLLVGEHAPYQQLWSSAPDVTMMGAYGGIDAGYEAVCAAISRAAANYQGWQPDYQEEPIAAVNDGRLGYVILRECVTNMKDSVERRRRVTVLFRQEGEQWRIFHHHSDPLHEIVSREPPLS
jgi:ketosteroid isomerase-like protein